MRRLPRGTIILNGEIIHITAITGLTAVQNGITGGHTGEIQNKFKNEYRMKTDFLPGPGFIRRAKNCHLIQLPAKVNHPPRGFYHPLPL